MTAQRKITLSKYYGLFLSHQLVRVSVVSLILSIIPFTSSSCADLQYCNGRGQCTGVGTCNCYAGWGATTDITLYRAPDCTARVCPAGNAWADVPTGGQQAHELAECSGRGLCDRKLGACKCFDNFVGPACERMKCPNDCSGHGRCLSMKNLAKMYESLPLSAVLNYNTIESSSAWDADKIFGCHCDSSWVVGYGVNETQEAEWFGPDCSLRHCPSGDDPTTAFNETDCAYRRQFIDNEGRNGINGTVGNLCHVDCAGRGTCDYKTGTCTCFNRFHGSNCATSSAYYVGSAGDAVITDDGIFTHLTLNGLE